MSKDPKTTKVVLRLSRDRWEQIKNSDTFQTLLEKMLSNEVCAPKVVSRVIPGTQDLKIKIQYVNGTSVRHEKVRKVCKELHIMILKPNIWQPEFEETKAGDLSNNDLLRRLEESEKKNRELERFIEESKKNEITCLNFSEQPGNLGQQASLELKVGLYERFIKGILELENEYQISEGSECQKGKTTLPEDLCRTLGVDVWATDRKIAKRFRKISKHYHPDKWAHGSPEIKNAFESNFKKKSAAYHKLIDLRKQEQAKAQEQDIIIIED